MSNNKLTNIQILRGLAAVWVVFFHSLGGGLNELTSILGGIGKNGRYGVDIFFVLSGFVIFYSARQREIPATKFFMRRVDRIVPPYLLLTTVFFLTVLLLPNLFKGQKASLDHFVRSVSYLSFTGYQYPVVSVGWTLEYEMFFYLLAALALACGRLAFSRLPIAICGVVLCGLLFREAGGQSVAIEFLTDPVVLEFCFGFAIATVLVTGAVDRYVSVAVIATLLAVSVVDPLHRVMLAGIPSAVLLGVCLVLNSKVTLSEHVRRPLSFIGDASYSIYLIQVFTLPIAIRLHKLLPGKMDQAFIGLVDTSVTIILGWAFFKVVESPMLNAIRARRKPVDKSVVTTAAEPLPRLAATDSSGSPHPT
jgi:peptidoglycan/LPS O-acetylase OafA/YrhL